MNIKLASVHFQPCLSFTRLQQRSASSLNPSCLRWFYMLHVCVTHDNLSIPSVTQHPTSVWSTLVRMIRRFRDDPAGIRCAVWVQSPSPQTPEQTQLWSCYQCLYIPTSSDAALFSPSSRVSCEKNKRCSVFFFYHFFPLFLPRTQTSVMFVAPRGSNLEHPPRQFAWGLSLLKNDAVRFHLRQDVHKNPVIFRYEAVSWKWDFYTHPRCKCAVLIHL